MASSAESVGGFWLGQVAKLMIEREFDGLELAKAIGFSHGQFGLVIESLDDSC